MIYIVHPTTISPSLAHVEPLCLPTAGVTLEGLLTDGQADVAGWGLTEAHRTAYILQKATLPFVNKATCNPLYDNLLLPEQVRLSMVNTLCKR